MPPSYTLRNNTNTHVMYSLSDDENVVRSIVIPAFFYVTVNSELPDEIFNDSAITITDSNNQVVNRDIYRNITENKSNTVEYSSVTGSPFTLTSSWQKVVTTTNSTKSLRISPIASSSTFDIEWISKKAGSSAPTDTYGEPIIGGEDFAGGIPVGDIYLKSATGQKAIVKVGN